MVFVLFRSGFCLIMGLTQSRGAKIQKSLVSLFGFPLRPPQKRCTQQKTDLGYGSASCFEGILFRLSLVSTSPPTNLGEL